MSAGIPVLASKVGACLEILDYGKYGYLFKKGDPDDLAKNLEMRYDFDNVKKRY